MCLHSDKNLFMFLPICKLLAQCFSLGRARASSYFYPEKGTLCMRKFLLELLKGQKGNDQGQVGQLPLLPPYKSDLNRVPRLVCSDRLRKDSWLCFWMLLKYVLLWRLVVGLGSMVPKGGIMTRLISWA